MKDGYEQGRKCGYEGAECRKTIYYHCFLLFVATSVDVRMPRVLLPVLRIKCGQLLVIDYEHVLGIVLLRQAREVERARYDGLTVDYYDLVVGPEPCVSGYPSHSFQLHGRTAELPWSDFNRQVICHARHTVRYLSSVSGKSCI